MVVKPSELCQFLGKRFDPSCGDFLFSSIYSEREVAEIFTVDTPQLDVCLDRLDREFRKVSRANHIERESKI